MLSTLSPSFIHPKDARGSPASTIMHSMVIFDPEGIVLFELIALIEGGPAMHC